MGWRVLTVPALVVPLAAAAGFVWMEGTGGAWKNHRSRRATPVALAPLREAEIGKASFLYAERCAGCHGEFREGGAGPALAGVGLRYPLEKIERIAHLGKGRRKQMPMPSGLVSPEDAHLIARWLVEDRNATTTTPAPGGSG